MDSPAQVKKIPDHITLFVFDWSGTLCDDIEPVIWANNAMLKKRGMNEIEGTSWKNARCCNAVDFAYRYGLLNPDIKSAIAEENVMNEFRDLYALAKAEVQTRMYDGAMELVRRLKSNPNYRVAIVSSAPTPSLISDMTHNKVLPHNDFHMIIGGTLDKAGSLLDVCTELGVNPGNSLYIGDCCQDITAARLAGYGICMAVSQGYHLEKHLIEMQPDLLIKEIAHFARLLNDGK